MRSRAGFHSPQPLLQRESPEVAHLGRVAHPTASPTKSIRPAAARGSDPQTHQNYVRCQEPLTVSLCKCEWWVGKKMIRATPGTHLFIPPGVAHNITNVSEKPARVLMTVSPPGHEHYFEELAKLAAQGSPDPEALADLRDRYDTDQLSTLTTRA